MIICKVSKLKLTEFSVFYPNVTYGRGLGFTRSNTGSTRRSASILQMARGLVLCSQTRTIAKLSFFLPYPKFWFKPHCHHHPCYGPQNIPSARVFCHCVSSQTINLIDMAKYNEAFSRRMAMAGIKHHNRIG